jgi:hypothetical protein
MMMMILFNAGVTPRSGVRVVPRMMMMMILFYAGGRTASGTTRP